MSVVDLNNTFKYDKIILNLNSSNCLMFNAAETNFYINLVEPIKNVIYIKILKSSIVSTTSIKNTPLSYEKYDPIYITLNDYDRSNSYIKGTQVITSNFVIDGVANTSTTTNTIFDCAKYFDLIPYSYAENSDISYSQTSSDWTDPSVYVLNPPEQILRRLNIQFRDKFFKLFNTSILTHFNLSICIYFIKNRV
uniref:Uncharacterized protein n=1 Tax=viral metagenome TaxID=1070528 RepID=A0A6C0IAW5_9ZZZZ